MNENTELTNIIKSNKQILLDELNRYGSQLSKNKTHYNCCHCTSSDALSIKETNNGYIYHCFSCGTGGDVIRLVQLQEGVNFLEAIKILCNRYGLDFKIKEKSSFNNTKNKKSKKQIQIEEYEKLEKEALANKDLEKAFEYHMKASDLKNNKHYKKINNKDNYANYNAEKIKIKKYIGEDENRNIQQIIESLFFRGGKALVVAPTGAGKTKETIDSLKRADTKAIFIVPNALNVEQIKQEYSIPGAWGDIPIGKELEKGKLIVVTWDKFGQIDKNILKDYIVILDEVHQTHIDMFRDEKINKLFENLAYTKGQIHITATPNKLNFKEYDYILEYEQEIKTNYNVFLYNKIDDNKIMDIASKSKKFALFKDDKKYLDFIKETMLNKNIDVITSKTRDFSKCYTDIVFNRNIGNVQGLCNTSVLVAGVNIYDKNITDIIIIGEKDIATIKQYVARFRDLKTVNVHIFNNYKEEYKVYSIEWLIEQIQEDVKVQVYYFNKTKNTSYIREALHKKPITIPNNNEFYFNQDENKYKVNEIGIRNFAYTFYYNQSTIEGYKELLGEYFSNIEIVKLDDPKNAARKKYNEVAKLEKEEILKELEQNRDKLVGAVKILTDKTDKKLENYLAQNKTDTETEYVRLLDLGVHKYIAINNIAKILNLYSTYVIEDGFTYNMAWSIATKGDRARGKIFAQINNIAYRKIEKKYKDYIDNTDLETRLYNQIVKTFKPGLSYTTEHLQIFIDDFMENVPIKLTVEQLQIRLNNIFKIDKEQIKKCTRVDKLFLYKIEPTHVQNKRIWIFTIVDFTSLDDLIEQNNWSEIDKKILKNLINKNIRKIDKEVQEIKYGLNVFEA